MGACRLTRGEDGRGGNHDLPKGASTMPDEDLERVLSAIQAIEKFAGRLPEGDVEGHIRRSAHELTLASEQRRDVEATFERLMQAVRQLDEHNTTGRLRRDFENEAPLVARLLEAIREQLVPALKRAGYQV
jgi:predicted ArsR family transcriptional regulator